MTDKNCAKILDFYKMILIFLLFTAIPSSISYVSSAASSNTHESDLINLTVELPDNNPNKWTILNEYYNKNGNYEEAENTIRQALSYYPEDPNLLHLLGLTLLNENRYKEASKIFKEVLELKPYSAPVYSNLGTASALLVDYSASVEAYSNAINIVPDYLLALNNLGLAHLYNNQPEEVIITLTRSIEIYPGDPAPWINIGSALFKLGDYDSAIKILNHALTLSPAANDIDEVNELINEIKESGKGKRYHDENVLLKLDSLMSQSIDVINPEIIYPSIYQNNDSNVANNITRLISFQYQNKTHYLTIDCPQLLYLACKGGYNAEILNDPFADINRTKEYHSFISDPLQTDVINSLKLQLSEISGNITGTDYLDVAKIFVASIPPDPVATERKFPLVSLIDYKADCDDKTVLLAALLGDTGYKIGIIEFPNHVVLGIAGLKPEFRKSGYCVIDTTQNVPIGIIQNEYFEKEMIVIPL